MYGNMRTTRWDQLTPKACPRLLFYLMNLIDSVWIRRTENIDVMPAATNYPAVFEADGILWYF